jgi:hypothetical protein
MSIKFLDEILKEIKEKGFASLPTNAISDEEYEE